MRIALAVGGTGGHILPALEMAKNLQKTGVDVHLIGVYLEQNRHLDKSFPYASVVGSNRSPLRITRGIWQSLRYLREKKIDQVIGFGSYHSLPPLAAAFLLKIPYALYEANIFPGRVNRLFAKRAEWTAVQFPETAKYLKSPVKAVNFLCEKFRSLESSSEKAAAYFGLSANFPTLLVVGGSQGASSINQKVLELLPSWQGRLQVIHLIGKKERREEIEKAYQTYNIPVVVKPFEENMHHAYTLASFAIARAGAATLAELIHFQVPALLIPYPKAAEGHQYKNGRYFVDQVGGGLCLEEKEFAHFRATVESFFDPLFLAKKREAIASYTNQ
jgi:UDP-N-acetylglucosamine--N-acetylmuramyl-(pentapeptide) pyrophosphoryl-undecaprenol N-acetylglucosamine transferase